MRNLHISIKLLLSLFLFAGIFACSKDDIPLTPKLFMETDSMSVSNQGAEYSIDMVSNLSWEAQSEVSWISFTETKAEKGNNVLMFAVAENEDDERKGKIIVSTSSGLKKEILITQEAGNRDDIYVKKGAVGEGYSWDEATGLAHALEIAVSGNTIHIAEGTYLPTKTVTGGNSADAGDLTFEINKNIGLKGGYPANASKGATADPSQFETILSGALEGGTSSYHVLTVAAPKIEGQKVVLQGLTISHGKADGENSSVSLNGIDFRRDYGGGVIIGNSTVDILNAKIVDNQSEKFVAGLYAFEGAVLIIKNSKVNRNVSQGNGAGLWVNASEAYIYGSEFNANECTGTAPGVHGYPDAKIHMFNSVVANNKGTSFGAGFYIRQNTQALLVNCLITGNSSTSAHGGGGIMMYNDNELSLISSTISGNNIAGPGGGIYRRSGVNTLNIYNSIISGNTQKDDGPDVDVYEDDATAPGITSSVIGSIAYDANGAEIEGTAFDAASMLDAGYAPVGTNNPALIYGMTGAELETLGNGFNPVIDAVIISSDLNGQQRANEKIMGALVN